ncbi:hypothetical protein NOCARDAX2BIS_240003 [Nocardioides sp. AX2bis]|nr:hypothetical protein NOCARDAX2BIS_240003 [Nocardioides sp. AX2bis]
MGVPALRRRGPQHLRHRQGAEGREAGPHPLGHAAGAPLGEGARGHPQGAPRPAAWRRDRSGPPAPGQRAQAQGLGLTAADRAGA